MSNWRNKIPHEQVESDPTKQNIITGQLHRLIKLGVLMPEASQISDTGIYVTIGLPSPTVTSKLQVGGTVAANEAEYDYELATLGQVKALAVPTLPQLKTINNESIVGTGNIVISGGVDITLGTQKNGLILVGQELSLGLATNLVSGALSDVDWNTFNSKQNSLGFTPENIANKNQNNGYAGLDSTGKINPLHLPALAITDTFVVGSESEMLSLVAEVGDVAIRTDLNKSFILCVSGASTLANWQELLTSVTVDQTIIDGSTNAVSGNAVFDGLVLKADLASPDLTGIPTAPTATSGVSTTQIATTAFVRNEINTAAYSYVKILGDQSIYGTKKFIANTMFFGLMAENTAGGSASFYASTQNNHSAVFVQGLGSTGNVVAINANPLASGNLLYIDVGSNPNLNFILGRKNSADVFKVDNNAVVTATSFVKGNTATSNILLAGGGDIPQSAFLTSVSPTLTGTPTAPTATAGTNTDQIATTAFVQDAASSGSYTPTVSASTNCVSPGALPSTYTKNGNTVTLRLNVLATNFTAANTFTTITVNLPVNRTLTDVKSIGSGSGFNALGEYWAAIAQTGTNNNTVLVSFRTPSTNGGNITLFVQYDITQ